MKTALRILAVLVTAVAISSCSIVVDDGEISFVNEDAQLLCKEFPSVILAAQAVPTASFIPCIDALPAGWRIEGTEFRSGRVIIAFDSKRAPIDDLTVTFTESCEAAESVADMADRPLLLAPDSVITTEATNARRVPGIRLVVQGDGYCADFDIEMEAPETIGYDDFPTWQWISRQQVSEWVAAGTNQKLHLDSQP